MDHSRYLNPELTSLRQPSREIARTAVDLMIDLIEGGVAHAHHVFPGELRLGESCAPPPAT